MSRSDSRSGAPEPSRRYARYVLGVLVVMYVFNYLDRYVLTILVEDVKRDLGASDTMIGFLIGPAFAVFYTAAGLPIARLADRRSRTAIISVGFVVWSALTAACGLVRSSAQLALARVGVGIGEAAGVAPAHSLISDYFPTERRAVALSVFQLGVFIGMMLGLVIGGWLVGPLGWRMTFVAVGLPGLAVAGLVYWSVREPRSGAPPVEPASRPSMLEVLWILARTPTFILIALGAGIASYSGTGFGVWVPTFLRRVHDMSAADVGLYFGVINSLSAAAGSLIGGWLTDVLGRRDPRWWVWMPAASVIASLPFLLGVVLLPDTFWVLVFFVPAGIGGGWAPAIYAAVQNLVRPDMRAVAASILILFTTLLGQGAGPQVVGVLNDWLEPGYGVEAVRYSIAIVLAASLAGGILFLLAGRTLPADLARVRAPTPD